MKWSILIIMMLLAVTIVSAVELYDESECTPLSKCRFSFVGDDKFVSQITLFEGWNLISYEGFDEIMNQLENNGEENKLKAIWLFNPIDQEYVSWDEFTKEPYFTSKWKPFKEANLESFFRDSNKLNSYSVWVYFDGSEESFYVSTKHYVVGVNTNADYAERNNLIKTPLYKGWNFLSIEPEMIFLSNDEAVEETFGELFVGCDIENMYYFDTSENAWKWMMNMLDDSMSYEGIGNGFIVKVSDDCTLKGGTGNPTSNNMPPEIPN